MPAHDASTFLTPSKPPYIFLTPRRTAIKADDVHSRRTGQTQKSTIASPSFASNVQSQCKAMHLPYNI